MSILTHQIRSRKFKSRTKIWKALAMIILAIQPSCVNLQTVYASYNFHGLSPGTTSVPCATDPTVNLDWTFPSKKQQSILFLMSSLSTNYWVLMLVSIQYIFMNIVLLRTQYTPLPFEWVSDQWRNCCHSLSCNYFCSDYQVLL